MHRILELSLPGIALACVALVAPAQEAGAVEFGSPVDCVLGEDCFVQQFVDTDPGPDRRDPFCGAATYDGHDGTDFRVRSMREVETGVGVLAMADGTVLRSRDGEPDRLVETDEDREAVAEIECGNGLIIEHEEGYETQYCHLRQGSIAVEPGDAVTRGQEIGEIGASGMAQFPHLHVTVRKDDATIDPVTGRADATSCLQESPTAATLFDAQTAAAIGEGESQLLDFGLSGNVIDHDALVRDGGPATATRSDEATVAWAWFVNLRDGDRLGFKVTAPDGSVHTQHVDEPVEGSKATYSGFAGKRGSPAAGRYEVMVVLVRDGEPVLQEMKAFTVE